jgi:2'-5' RNA ligase
MMERHFYALLPSRQVSDLVDEMRARYYPRGIELHPPHITIVPPFQTDQSDEIWSRVEAVSQPFRPFHLRLLGWGVFSNRQEILHLKVSPSPELQVLRDRLLEVSGVSSDWEDFHPHLTVGKFSTEELSRVQGEIADREVNLEFTSDRLVDFREMGDGGWKIAHQRHLT